MSGLRGAPVAVLAAVLLFALGGCGGDDGGSSDKPATGGAAGGQAAADKFTACFKQPGYEAAAPEPGEESLFALSAKKAGYNAIAVNVAKPGSVAADAFLVFFADEAEATKAFDELAVSNAGDTAPLRKGAAVVGYLDDNSKTAVQPAIDKCL